MLEGCRAQFDPDRKKVFFCLILAHRSRRLFHPDPLRSKQVKALFRCDGKEPDGTV